MEAFGSGTDVRTFANERLLWNDFVLNLYEDTDVRATYLDAFVARNVRQHPTQQQEQQPLPPSHVSVVAPHTPERCTGTIHVSDVDWEDTPTGAQVFVYGRSTIDRNQTYLLTAPIHDYFYIEVSVTDAVSAKHLPSAACVRSEITNTAFYLGSSMNSAFSNEEVLTREKRMRKGKSVLANCICDLITKVEVIDDHKTLYGYQRSPQKFLKFTTASPTVSKALFYTLSKRFPHWRWYEVSLCPINKFMTARGFAGCTAVDFEGVRNEVNALSTDDVHVSQCTSIQASQAENLPFYTSRNMFYDIECLSTIVNEFPKAETCPVIQISFVVMDGTDTELSRGVLCLQQTPGDAFESFDSEEQMLMRFSQLVRHWRPEMLIGFNSNAFDMPYILDRMGNLGIDFAKAMSRRKGLRLWYERSMSESNQAGAAQITKYLTPGLTMMDQYVIVKSDPTMRLRSYRLNDIAKQFLKGETKEDLRYKDIPDLFKTPEGRSKIASYCLQDSVLLVRLDKVLSLVVKATGMASVLGTTPTVTLTRGLVFKLMGKVKQYTEKYNFLVRSFTEKQKPRFEGKYKGAFVVEPILGLHTDPVVVCDAASLYPSVMRADNLSWDTMLLEEDEKYELQHHGDLYSKKYKNYYVKKDIHEGILVKLQTDLAAERKAARKKRDEFAYGSDGYNVYESVQLSTKVAMNSLYGALGTNTSDVPMVQIAKTITGRGRYMLNLFKNFVLARYVAITGEAQQAIIVYGDTDSIFIKMPGVPIDRAIKHGHALEEHFRREKLVGLAPHNFEYEKTFMPFMITSKKHYIGALYENDPSKPKMMKAMGLQNVRRDSTKLCVECMEGFFHKFVMENDTEAALEHVRTMLRDMYAGKLPVEYFSITRKIGRSYQNKPAWIKAWESMAERIGPEAPVIGEQFQYVMMRTDKKSTGAPNAPVDLVKVKENDLRAIDYEFYRKRSIDTPLRNFIMFILSAKYDTPSNKNSNNSNDDVEFSLPEKIDKHSDTASNFSTDGEMSDDEEAAEKEITFSDKVIEEAEKILSSVNYVEKRTADASASNILGFWGVQNYTVWRDGAFDTKKKKKKNNNNNNKKKKTTNDTQASSTKRNRTMSDFMPTKKN